MHAPSIGIEPPAGQYSILPVDKVIYGPGSVQGLPNEIERMGATRVLVVTSGSIANRTPLADRVTSLLGPRCVGVWSGIRQHAPSDTVVAAELEVERLDADLLLSLGGGSVIDTTKAVALSRDASRVLPHVALPTTLSAAEFSTLYGVTDSATKLKTSHNDVSSVPRLVILDAELTVHTPDWLWLSSGIRALDHAVETIYAPEHGPVTDATSLEAIRLLFKHLAASVGSEDQLAHRQFCQVAAWLSFFGVVNVTLGLSHILGRKIGPRYDVPHGYTSAVLLPHVMTEWLEATASRQALIAAAAGADISDLSDTEAAALAPRAVSSLVERLGLPQRLRDLKVPRADLEVIANGRRDVLSILQRAW